jgi:two-component system phosphate regulon sensor histidine kinase PhoR
LKKRTIYIVIFVVSVVGLAIVQYQYLEIGLNLARVQFNRNIGKASDAIRADLSSGNQLTFLIGKALQRDSTYFKLGIDSVQDASRYFLNDFITEKLATNGIDTDFTYDLYSRDTTFYLQSPMKFEQEDKIAAFPIVLQGYLPELLNNRLILELKFRDLNSYFLFQLNGLTLPSLLFLVGIVSAIIWVLRTYYWQRNLITHTNEFINNFTHELKTPVFSIGLASKLLDDNATAAQKPVLNIIRQQVASLSNHIDRVLDLASLEARRKVFNFELIDFKPYLKNLCEDFQTLVSMEEVAFSYNLEPGEYWRETEVFHLENAINNLLDNGKKYADDPVVQLKAGVKKSKLWVEIRDNGRGIDEIDQKRIFQKHYRVSQGDLHNVKGYGLGLSYVKKVIESMKGKITVESRKGEGTRITLEIPIRHAG